ncbi:DUF4350 domain-containing protein [Infirmifilum sp. NZ]|uniref:DUF4350 domain-containing protein n=1 Tax=Infirmifilum sp. NZ TaxID=2926850 RepID=UPI00279F7EC5|nr:DUF4350 domain-containing protein [Infirmifilum sp. NZ]UNQ73136.1 DUF4350 domain-containing protein [Infirmifilum sp. NZ]
MRGYILLGLGLALVVLVLMVALVPSTDDFSPDNPLWNGLTAFCQAFNVSVVGVADIGGLPRDSALVIVGPSLNLSGAGAAGLRGFVEEGGLLVVADDFGSGNSILEALGVSTRVGGALLEDGVFMYRSPLLPRAVSRVNGSGFDLYLNYASYVEPDGRGVCLAYSSPFSYLDLNSNGVRDEGEPYGPFCVAYEEPLGRGRVVVLSDASIFINSMLSMGGNYEMIGSVLGQRGVYVLGGLWSGSTYTYARSLIVGAVGLVYGSTLRYVSVPLTGLLVYVVSLLVYRRVKRVIPS